MLHPVAHGCGGGVWQQHKQQPAGGAGAGGVLLAAGSPELDNRRGDRRWDEPRRRRLDAQLDQPGQPSRGLHHAGRRRTLGAGFQREHAGHSDADAAAEVAVPAPAGPRRRPQLANKTGAKLPTLNSLSAATPLTKLIICCNPTSESASRSTSVGRTGCNDRRQRAVNSSAVEFDATFYQNNGTRFGPVPSAKFAGCRPLSFSGHPPLAAPPGATSSSRPRRRSNCTTAR